MQKVFVVEDDENIRELVIYALKSAGFEAEGFETGREFFAALSREIPDIVLLDIMLPEEDGISILKKLRADKPVSGLPVIMLTAKNGEIDRVRGLDLGADDYIVKPFSVMEMIARVRAVLRRRLVNGSAGEDAFSCGDITLDNKRHAVSASGEPVELTLKEYELLRILLLNQGIVLSREKIMNDIWGFDFEIESRTVDMHVKTLRQKLGSAGEHIKTVRGVGYKME